MNEQEVEQLLQETLQNQGLNPEDLSPEQLNQLRQAIASQDIEQVAQIVESLIPMEGEEAPAPTNQEEPAPQEVNMDQLNMEQEVAMGQGQMPMQDPMMAMMGGGQMPQEQAPPPLSKEPKGNFNYQEEAPAIDMEQEVAMGRDGYVPPPEMPMEQPEEEEVMLSDEDIQELLDDDETNDDIEPDVLKGILNGSKDAELIDKVGEEGLDKLKLRVKALIYEMEEAM